MILLGIDPGLATLGWGVIEAGGGRETLQNRSQARERRIHCA